MSPQTQHDPKNEAEITYWNSAAGRHWVERQQSQDIVLGPILQATLERAQLRQGECVVDIGCGTGASSIALGERVGPSKQELGVDVSALTESIGPKSVRKPRKTGVAFLARLVHEAKS
jgi:SAM-dependent methyltransferase